MAIYKLNSKKKKEGSSRGKKIIGFSFIGASSLVFLFMTGIVPVIQRFLIGVFGVFGFPLCIIMFVIGLALVNNRKYVMPKRYTACLCQCFLCFAFCNLSLLETTSLSLKKAQNKQWIFGNIWLKTTTVIMAGQLAAFWSVFLQQSFFILRQFGGHSSFTHCQLLSVLHSWLTV